MISQALITPDNNYRYWLSRIWDETKKPAVFIGLNPSTADATTDDPTIRRCIRFARDWGYGGLVMINLFAYRATNPKAMFQQDNPVGAENFKQIGDQVKNAGIIIAAWGEIGHETSQAKLAMARGFNLHCLGWTKSGAPRHPLYVRASTKPQPFN